MVDFRYHLVSIIAVFLALAVGIVLGTTTINPGVVSNLEGQVKRLTNDKDNANTKNDELQKKLDTDSQFAREVMPLAVTGRLAEQRVVIVSLPGAPNDVRDGVQRALQSAGATVSGRVRLQDKLVDPSQSEAVTSAAREASGALPPPVGSPVQQVATLLAEVLTTTDIDAPPSLSPTAEPSPIVAALVGADLLRVEGDAPTPVSTLVFVAPAPPQTLAADAEVRVKAVNEIVSALSRRARAVLATPSGGGEPGGVLEALRRDPALSTDVSSVDNADQPAGQTALVFALVERLKGRFGHYGSGPGAESAIPDIVAVS
jgi:hypothetical protein